MIASVIMEPREFLDEVSLLPFNFLLVIIHFFFILAGNKRITGKRRRSHPYNNEKRSTWPRTSFTPQQFSEPYHFLILKSKALSLNDLDLAYDFLL